MALRSLVLLAAAVVAAGATSAVQAPLTDLDAFMAQVLARRDENWKKLQQYILDEREEMSVVGPAGAPIWGERRDYTWFVRDGVFVRSPLRVNGVTVSEADRRQYEGDFARRARRRDRRGASRDEPRSEVNEDDRTSADPAAPSASDTPVDPDSPIDEAMVPADALLTATRQPQFIDNAYFLRFRFEPGRYALVGRERFEGREVLRIEYYPERLFRHEQNDQTRRVVRGERNRAEDVEAATERMMNKVSLVTLWVEPTAHQIVRYTFDNVEMDFLPAAWLLRITDATASMTMGEPFPGVWLPREVEMRFGAMFAVGAIDVRYRIAYADYREATTSGRMLSVPSP